MAFSQTFSKAKSQKQIAEFIKIIRERGNVTKLDLMTLTGLCEASVRGYMRHMVEINAAYIAQQSKRGYAIREWSVYGDVLPPAPATLDIDDMPRRVVVRTSWTPNHARMAMDCLLFGVPVAMQRVAV
jgi:hypothetical protein